MAATKQQDGWWGVPAHWWLGAILLLGTGLRIAVVAREPLWGDEALSLVIANFSYVQLMFAPVDPTPGLYYVIQKALLGAGYEPWIVRLPSLVAGIATIGAAFWLGRAACDARAGLWCALFVALFPDLIDYSVEARAYALLILLFTLAAAAALLAFPAQGKVRAGRLLWAGGFAVLAVYTHVTAWFALAPLGAVVLVRLWQSRAVPVWQIGGALLVGAGLVAPELWRAFHYAQSGGFNWLAQPTALGFADLVSRMIGPGPANVAPNRLGTLVPDWPTYLKIVWASHVLLLLGLIWIRVKLPKTGPHAMSSLAVPLLICWLIVYPLGLYLFGLVTPLILPRTLLPMLVGLSLGVSLFVRQTGSWKFGLAALAFVASEMLLFGVGRPKPEWERAVALVEAEQPSDGVVICSHWTAGSFIYERLRGDPPPLAVGAVLGRYPLQAIDGELPFERAHEGFWRNVYALRVPGIERPAQLPLFDPAGIKDAVLIDFHCEGAERAAFDQWFPEASRERLDYIPAGPDYAPMTVSRFRR
ncbi:glycosyltransferase family 39 protein [Sphingomicrobium arenosum]|uniref:glycosyltransferase family 39 protein n=1 Tax=Sphingomicrobium arenosum TaxID=2233861 RepID=UPI00224082B6|nr:glycosyltransferase family 39 protein [Sphingomicrobium arenosum]